MLTPNLCAYVHIARDVRQDENETEELGRCDVTQSSCANN